MSTDEHALPANHRLQQFTIDQVIGQGGFGITYLARDRELERPVAIKEYFPRALARRDRQTTDVMPRDRKIDPYQFGLGRFLDEAKTLARFDHPNIIRVYGFFKAGNTAYMVMPYEQGETLQDSLRHCGRALPEARIRQLALPLLHGLSKVHEAGFLHRDIKPGNIYLRRNGEPLLLDFGSARQAALATSQSLTALVSVGYAPPEQYATASRLQGPWSDLYALGATLYRCIGGAGPIDALARLEAIREGEADPLVSATVVGAGHYPAELLALIDRMLEPRFRHRPQAASEITQVLTGPVPRPRSAQSASAPARIATTGSHEAATESLPDERDDAPQHTARTRRVASAARPRRWPALLAATLAIGALGVLLPLAPSLQAVLSGQVPWSTLPWWSALAPVLLALALPGWYYARSVPMGPTRGGKGDAMARAGAAPPVEPSPPAKTVLETVAAPTALTAGPATVVAPATNVASPTLAVPEDTVAYLCDQDNHQVYGAIGSARPVVIGRSSTATITLSDDAISGRHLRIDWDSARQRAMITDLGSANGTYIGRGQRIAASVPIPLAVNEPFYLARTDLAFVLRSAL